MVSLSMPCRRIRRMLSSTVISGRRVTYSVVIMEPAEFSGYRSSWLMVFRISGSAVFKIRLTTLAGISSTMSAASSAYSSSSTSFSSLSEKPRISSSWASGSISTKVSAACSLGSRRKTMGIWRSSRSSKTAAISLGFMVPRISRKVAYFFSSSICRSAFSTISKRSAMVHYLLN